MPAEPKLFMDTAIEILGYGGILPAGISIAVAYLCWKFLPSTVRDQYAAAFGCAAAFFVGYVLLPAWAELVPKRHWQWLPYLFIGAAILGPIGATRSSIFPIRLLVSLALSLLGAWLLVPTWPRLEGIRPYWVAGLAAYLLILTTALDKLAVRLPAGRLFPTLLAVVLGSIAATVAYAVSAKYGQVAGIAAAGLFGCSLASLWFDPVRFTQGLLPIFGLAAGGLAFAGFIEPDPPLYPLLILPAAPLILWLFTRPALSRLQGKSAATGQIVAVLLTVGALITWVVFAGE